MDIIRVMYEAYGDDADWKSVSGHPMPRYDDLPPRIVHHWQASWDAAHKALMDEMGKSHMPRIGQELENGSREE